MPASAKFASAKSRLACFLLHAAIVAPVAQAAPAQQQANLPLSGHVLPALAYAFPASRADTAPLTVTLVLNRDDEAGFQKYLRDVYDPTSETFRHFMSAQQIAEKFGPSHESYARLSSFVAAQNLSLTTPSANRMTLTVTGARADVEKAFAVHIGDYTIGERTFFANRDAPMLPADIAPHVNAVLGLSNLAQSTRARGLSQRQSRSKRRSVACQDVSDFRSARHGRDGFEGRRKVFRPRAARGRAVVRGDDSFALSMRRRRTQSDHCLLRQCRRRAASFCAVGTRCIAAVGWRTKNRIGGIR